MQKVDLQMAEVQLSRLVDAAVAGEEIILARDGTPVARLVPIAAPAPRQNRVFGALAGQFTVPDDFDAPLSDEELARFEGR